MIAFAPAPSRRLRLRGAMTRTNGRSFPGRARLVAALLVVAAAGAAAQGTSVERGRYLVTTIMACGNCHTPKDGERRADRRQGALGRRHRLRHPALRRRRGQHHARPRDRHRQLDRRRDQARHHPWRAPGARPARRQAAGRSRWPRTSSRRSCRRDQDAIVAYLRSVPPVRQCPRRAGLPRAGERDAVRPRRPRLHPRPTWRTRRGAAPTSPPSATAWSATRRRASAACSSSTARSAPAAGRSCRRSSRACRRAGRARSRATSRPTASAASAPGATPRSSGRSRRASAATAAAWTSRCRLPGTPACATTTSTRSSPTCARCRPLSR